MWMILKWTFLRTKCTGTIVRIKPVFINADDMVIFCGKCRGVTSYVKYIIFLYYKMEPYCQWSENQIVIFRNGGKIRSDGFWMGIK